MNKAIKFSLLIAILGLALYNSVNIKALDEVKNSQEDSVFDAKMYAEDFMSNNIESLKGISANDFLENIYANVKLYSETNGKKLGISDEFNFIIEGDATVLVIEEEYVVVALENDRKLRIATNFIFGNAIRDGSAMAAIGDYQNTMDFNSISVALNTIVRETIIPPFKEKVQKGDVLKFKGAVKLDITKPVSDELKVIPLLININN